MQELAVGAKPPTQTMVVTNEKENSILRNEIVSRQGENREHSYKNIHFTNKIKNVFVFSLVIVKIYWLKHNSHDYSQ